ncbi:MAG: CopD family protein, partial [Pseudomonadota bacterium]|nr:CopD family protein [Pseudomonadota bacterium]
PYGQLLVTKILLFGAMLALAALNRFRLTPRFEQAMASDDHVSAMGALRLSLSFETGCVIAILALVAMLGTLAPPLSAV